MTFKAIESGKTSPKKHVKESLTYRMLRGERTLLPFGKVTCVISVLVECVKMPLSCFQSCVACCGVVGVANQLI